MRNFVLLLLISILGLWWTYEGPGKWRQGHPLVAPSKSLVHFSMGQNEILADMLWVRWIQNLEYCGPSSAPVETRKPPPVRAEDVLNSPLSPAQCHLGWSYQMVDVITDLASKDFLMHKYGALFLSVDVGDREGAKFIYNKAIQRFPDDWTLLYQASYHFLFELHQQKKAAELLLAASEKKGSPYFLPSLAARLLTLSGQKELAVRHLKDYIAQNPGTVGAKYAEQRLRALAN